MSEKSLNAKLAAALASRDERQIRRRLPDTNTAVSSSTLIDFNSNDYLSLSTSTLLRDRFLSKLHAAPDILGSGGSRLLVNGPAHSSLEERIKNFFGSEAALLFNSGFDANVGFFSCIPQPGDVILYDEYIHASVHDGVRASRVRDAQYSFSHNSVQSLRQILLQLKKERPGIRSGINSIFVAVESLYSMDGTFSPLTEIIHLSETLFPKGNCYLVVDEAHATGIYGPQGRGRVAELGLDSKVLARLHTFGKALAASGAVVLTTILIRDYLVNYARSIIFTTSLSYATVISIDCSFDLLEDRTACELSTRLLKLSSHFTSFIRPKLASIPSDLLSLPHHLANVDDCASPSPIIPLMTSMPRPLSAHLLTLGINARPISWPTVPKGKARVRVCIHAGNTTADLDRLALGAIQWAQDILQQRQQDTKTPERCENEGRIGSSMPVLSKL